MPVIAIVNRKGGSGKSTLATNLAAHFAKAGLAVMLGDVDRQQSTQTWLRLRGQQSLPASVPIVGWAVDPRRVLRPPAGITHVILDTPGGIHGFDLARVAACADVILMPVCNSVFDRESAADCHAELIALPRIASGRCQLAAIGMRLDARTKAAQVLDAWAGALKLPFLGVLRETQAYVRCIEQGLSLFDVSGAATEADLAQWRPIVAWLESALRAPRAPLGDAAAQTAAKPPTLATAAAPIGALEGARVPVTAASDHAFNGTASGMAHGAVATLQRHRAQPAVVVPIAPPRGTAAALLANLRGWLAAPRFVQRNS